MYDFPNVHPVDKNTMYRMRIQLAWYGSYQANWPYMNHISQSSWIFNFIELIWRARYRWNKAVYIVPAENNVSLRYLIDLMINIYIQYNVEIAWTHLISAYMLLFIHN